MPTIGPRITALGDTDFISAHTSAARQISPRSGRRGVAGRHQHDAHSGQHAAGKGNPQVVEEAADDDFDGGPEAAVDGSALPDADAAAGHRTTFFRASHENSAQRVGSA